MLATKSFLSWVEHTAEEVRRSAILQRIVTRWLHVSLSTAWFTWLDAVAQRQRLRRVADKAVRRWVRLQLAATWSAWLQALSVSQDVGAVSRECASTKVLKRWRNQRVAGCFQAWSEASWLLVHARRTCTKIVLKMKSKTAAAGFDGWVHGAAEQVPLSCAVLSAVLFWPHDR